MTTKFSFRFNIPWFWLLIYFQEDISPKEGNFIHCMSRFFFVLKQFEIMFSACPRILDRRETLKYDFLNTYFPFSLRSLTKCKSTNIQNKWHYSCFIVWFKKLSWGKAIQWRQITQQIPTYLRIQIWLRKFLIVQPDSVLYTSLYFIPILILYWPTMGFKTSNRC